MKKYRKRSKENIPKKCDPEKFAKSPRSKELLEYFCDKFPITVALIALLKCVVIVSCKLARPWVSMLHIAPSRSFKSYTSNEARKKIEKEFYINTRSDFTIHGLERYKQKLKDGRCLLINDGTLLFASKAKRTKDRLVGALSELLSENVYTYQDFNRKFSLTGIISLIMNMTSETYKNYKDRLLGWTFSERVLAVYHVLTESEMLAWVVKEVKSKKIRFKHKITVDDIETNVKEIPSKYTKLIQYQAKELSYISLKGFMGCKDLIQGTLRAHAALNNRQEVCDDDFEFLSLIKDFLTNPYCPYDGEIVKYAAQGLSYREICRKIGKPNHINYVYSLVQKARIRGILTPEPKSDHDEKKGKAPANRKENVKGAD